jgi:hypothetical protein
MKTLGLFLALLTGSAAPLAAQQRHLPVASLNTLETALRRYSPGLRIPVPAVPTGRAALTSLTRPGRVAQYEWNPGTSQWEMPQITLYAYTAQGLPELETRSDSALALPSYRLAYTYNARQQRTELLQQDYFGGTWTNSFRQTTAFDSQGNATEEVGQDWISGAWTTTFGTRTANTYTASDFLAQQVVQTFRAATATFEPDYRVTYKVPASGPYTEFTVQRWASGQWEDESRVTGIVWDAGRRQPLSLEVQIPINAVWVSVQRLTAVYQPNGSSVAVYERRPNPAGPWLNDERTTDTYDAYGNRTDLLHETWDGSAWEQNDRYHALLTYDAQHVVLRRDEQLATGAGGLLVNQQRFNFGSFVVIPLGADARTQPVQLSLYPNPAAGPVLLHLTGLPAAGPVAADVRNSLGQAVASFPVWPGRPTVLPPLPAGIYIVRVLTPRGALVARLAQQ